MKVCASLFTISEFTSKTAIYYPLVARKYNVAIQYLNYVSNKSCGAALTSFFVPGRVSCVFCVCVCVSKQQINLEWLSKALMHTSIGVCIVGANRHIMMCSGILVVGLGLRL